MRSMVEGAEPAAGVASRPLFHGFNVAIVVAPSTASRSPSPAKQGRILAARSTGLPDAA